MALDVVNEPRSKRARKGASSRRWLVAPACCVALLGLLTVDHVLFHLPPGDPGPYQARVKKAIEAIPMDFGAWHGKKTQIPRAAVELLRPNVILGRRYTNRKLGCAASLLIVDCTDARDIRGHFPPICYPANGWKTADPKGTPKNWNVAGLSIPGTEYRFFTDDAVSSGSIIVDNFILRPSGHIDRTMKQMSVAAWNPRQRPFGGAQVQVVFDASVPAPLRDRAFSQLIKPCVPAIHAILNGEKE